MSFTFSVFYNKENEVLIFKVSVKKCVSISNIPIRYASTSHFIIVTDLNSYEIVGIRIGIGFNTSI